MGHFYERYIQAIFENDGERGTNQYFEYDLNLKQEKLEIELEEKPALQIEVLHAAFTDIDKHLSGYTVFQLSNALDYIFNPSLSNLGFVFNNNSVNLQKRIETLKSLSDLILHIYEETAEPILGHLNQSPKDKRKNSLNGVCYMFWDTACIPYNCDKEIVDTCLSIMGTCAQSHNIAVVEGALHGLGHAQNYSDDVLINKYIDGANFGTGEYAHALRIYANAARRGMVQ